MSRAGLKNEDIAASLGTDTKMVDHDRRSLRDAGFSVEPGATDEPKGVKDEAGKETDQGRSAKQPDQHVKADQGPDVADDVQRHAGDEPVRSGPKAKEHSQEGGSDGPQQREQRGQDDRGGFEEIKEDERRQDPAPDPGKAQDQASKSGSRTQAEVEVSSPSKEKIATAREINSSSQPSETPDATKPEKQRPEQAGTQQRSEPKREEGQKPAPVRHEPPARPVRPPSHRSYDAANRAKQVSVDQTREMTIGIHTGKDTQSRGIDK